MDDLIKKRKKKAPLVDLLSFILITERHVNIMWLVVLAVACV